MYKLLKDGRLDFPVPHLLVGALQNISDHSPILSGDPDERTLMGLMEILSRTLAFDSPVELPDISLPIKECRREGWNIVPIDLSPSAVAQWERLSIMTDLDEKGLSILLIETTQAWMSLDRLRPIAVTIMEWTMWSPMRDVPVPDRPENYKRFVRP